MDERAALRWLRARFREVGTPERATFEKAYLKSDLRFYGVTQPEVRRAATDLLRQHPDVDPADPRGRGEVPLARSARGARPGREEPAQRCGEALRPSALVMRPIARHAQPHLVAVA